jgi:hypothetical protein
VEPGGIRENAQKAKIEFGIKEEQIQKEFPRIHRATAIIAGNTQWKVDFSK